MKKLILTHVTFDADHNMVGKATVYGDDNFENRVALRTHLVTTPRAGQTGEFFGWEGLPESGEMLRDAELLATRPFDPRTLELIQIGFSKPEYVEPEVWKESLKVMRWLCANSKGEVEYRRYGGNYYDHSGGPGRQEARPGNVSFAQQYDAAHNVGPMVVAAKCAFGNIIDGEGRVMVGRGASWFSVNKRVKPGQDQHTRLAQWDVTLELNAFEIGQIIDATQALDLDGKKPHGDAALPEFVLPIGRDGEAPYRVGMILPGEHSYKGHEGSLVVLPALERREAVVQAPALPVSEEKMLETPSEEGLYQLRVMQENPFGEDQWQRVVNSVKFVERKLMSKAEFAQISQVEYTQDGIEFYGVSTSLNGQTGLLACIERNPEFSTLGQVQTGPPLNVWQTAFVMAVVQAVEKMAPRTVKLEGVQPAKAMLESIVLKVADKAPDTILRDRDGKALSVFGPITDQGDKFTVGGTKMVVYAQKRGHTFTDEQVAEIINRTDLSIRGGVVNMELAELPIYRFQQPSGPDQLMRVSINLRNGATYLHALREEDKSLLYEKGTDRLSATFRYQEAAPGQPGQPVRQNVFGDAPSQAGTPGERFSYSLELWNGQYSVEADFKDPQSPVSFRGKSTGRKVEDYFTGSVHCVLDTELTAFARDKGVDGEDSRREIARALSGAPVHWYYAAPGTGDRDPRTWHETRPQGTPVEAPEPVVAESPVAETVPDDGFPALSEFEAAPTEETPRRGRGR